MMLSLCSCQEQDRFGKNQATLQEAKIFSEKSEQYYQDALKQYQKVLESHPEQEDIYYQIALLHQSRGEYDKAVDVLSQVKSDRFNKLRAICLYRSGRYTDALGVFERMNEFKDDKYFYYYALTCEEHNLHTKALELYKKIKSDPFLSKANMHIQSINALKEKTTLQGLDEEIQNLISNAPSQEDFPQAGAVILLSRENVEIKENYSVVSEDHYLIKILNERGKHFGEIKIPYDSTYGKVEIVFARTIKPNGEVVSVGSKHIRDVSRYLNFPLYSNARVKIISMPEVAIGSILEYKVRSTQSKMIANNKFNTSYFVQNREPIQYQEFKVTLPKKDQLQTRIINKEMNQQNFNLNPEIIQDEKTITYSWVFENVDQIIPEPLMPPVSESAPMILMTTFQTWEEIYTWWWELAKDKIKVNEDIKKKVAELTEGLEDLKQKAKAVYNFCARDIRYVGIEYGQAGYEPHDATEIFSNKYGDCKDQAILLISMLKEAGIKAYPVIIGTRGVPRLSKEFPALSFNHCIAVAEIDGEYIFLDPTGEVVLFGDLPTGDQGRDVFVCFEENGRILWIPKFSSEHNKIVRQTRLMFDEDEQISGSRQAATSGVFDQMQRGWLRYTMPILVKESLQEKIQSIVPGSSLISYDVENLGEMQKDIVLSYLFKGSDFFLTAGKTMRVVPQLTSIDLEIVSKVSRVYPIDFVVPRYEENIFEIIIPDNYQVTSLPESIVSDTLWYRYESIYTQEGKKIILKEKNTLKKESVDSNDYFAYKKSLEELSKKIRQSIILEK